VKAPCKCGCGKPSRAHGYAEACYRRWLRAGRPDAGAPAPLTYAEVAERRWPSLPDPGDLAGAAASRAAVVAGRALRAEKLRVSLVHLSRCAAAGDSAGVRVLLEKLTGPEREAVLAAWRQQGRRVA
jgi:hypothetical protein